MATSTGLFLARDFRLEREEPAMPKKRKGKMRIIQGERAGPAPGKPGHTVYDPVDPDPFRIPTHVKQAYNKLADSARKRLKTTAAKLRIDR